jgi:hypothetical protein
MLETETSSTGTVTSGDTLYKMALFQRSITNSMSLVPGLTVQTTGGTAGLSAYTVNGQRNTGTAMFADGLFGVDPVASALAILKPIENSTEEVKMLTGTLPAEYGHSAGGVIATVRERYERTPRVGLRLRPHPPHDPRQFSTRLPRPNRSREIRGRAVLVHAARRQRRRPIVIPKLYNGRNKTFSFWLSETGSKRRPSRSFNRLTPDMLNGDFTLAASASRSLTR